MLSSSNSIFFSLLTDPFVILELLTLLLTFFWLVKLSMPGLFQNTEGKVARNAAYSFKAERPVVRSVNGFWSLFEVGNSISTRKNYLAFQQPRRR